jgi:hypothetical protein
MFSVGSVQCAYKRSKFRCKFISGQLPAVATHNREPVRQGHESIMEESCEDSAVKCQWTLNTLCVL